MTARLFTIGCLPLLASLVCAQTADRMLPVSTSVAAPDIKELAMVVWQTVGAHEVVADPQQHALRANGTAGQLNAAEWILHELDGPPPAGTSASSANYPMADDESDGIRVLRFGSAVTGAGLREQIPTVRPIADVTRLFSLGTDVVLRAGAVKADFVERLFRELNSGPPLLSAEISIPFANGQIARMVRVDPVESVETLSELTAATRGIADVMYAYPLPTGHQLLLRSDAGRMALALWLIGQLTEPARGEPVYRVPATSDVVRIFRLTNRRESDLSPIVDMARAQSNTQRIFGVGARKSVVVRVPQDRIDAIEQMMNKFNMEEK